MPGGREPATIRPASMQRIGRSRLPPANTLCRMAWWIEVGRCVAAGNRRSSAASVSAWPCSRVCLSMRVSITSALQPLLAESSVILSVAASSCREEVAESKDPRVVWQLAFVGLVTTDAARTVKLIGVLRLRNAFALRSRPSAQDDKSSWQVRMTICAGFYQARRLRLEVFRSASAEFLPSPRPLPVPCGKLPKAACLPQTESGISLEALRLFPAPARFSPDAGGNLQTWPR